jgi:flagellar basal-body rod protein FlgF
MDKMLYLAMSGARQTLLAQSMAAHNLANATTTGFRADLADARSMPVFGPGEPSRVYAMTERPAIDFRPGSIVYTGNELDVAVKGEGWLAVQSPDGREAYTRAGDLRVTVYGQLETGAGHPVLGNGGPITIPPAEKLEIGVDGTISIRPVGQAANTLAEVDRIKLVQPANDTLIKGEDGLFRLKEGEALPPASAAVTLAPGALESSNVNAVDAMVRMIELSRQFDLHVKAMKTAEEDDAAATQLMRMS